MGKSKAKKQHTGMATGLIFLGLGIVFLLNNFDLVDLGHSWPLILVAVGLALIAGARRRELPDRHEQS